MTAQNGKVMEIAIRMILILITFELIFFIVQSSHLWIILFKRIIFQKW
jgi:hypothetical protein